MANNVEVLEPEVVTEQSVETKDELVHKLILWNDDKSPMDLVIMVLYRYFKFTPEKAVEKVLFIHNNGKDSIMEGTIKELERYFIILVDHELNATIE